MQHVRESCLVKCQRELLRHKQPPVLLVHIDTDIHMQADVVEPNGVHPGAM